MTSMDDYGDAELRQEPLADPGDGMSGVRLSVGIGRISPRAAAAVWWNQPAQTDEMFPGATFRFRSGDLASNGFVYEVCVDLPAVGPFTQAARYTVAPTDRGGFRITVDAFEENVLWVRGLGVYEFHDDGGSTTLRVDSRYQAKMPIEALNAAAVDAARAHRRRYLAGRQPTSQEELDLAAALAGPG
jgi:hypothetical protein